MGDGSLCYACGKRHDNARMIDGMWLQSEEYRSACEARFLLTKSVRWRLAYLDKVEEKRGNKAKRQLMDDMNVQIEKAIEGRK